MRASSRRSRNGSGRTAPDHPAWGREASAAPDGLHEADGVLLNLRLVPQDVEDDAGNRDVLDAAAEGRRADQAGAVVPVADDSPVLNIDPGGEAIGLAKAILVAQALEVAFLEMLRRRLVVRATDSNGSFGIPSIASDGIQEIAVTDDSMRITHPVSSTLSTLEHQRRCLVDGSAANVTTGPHRTLDRAGFKRPVRTRSEDRVVTISCPWS